MDGDITGGTGITVKAIAGNEARSVVTYVGGGIIEVSGTSADSEISDGADTDAIVGSSAQISSPSAAIVVSATSNNFAKATAKSTGGGAIDVRLIETEATSDADTSAKLLGDVGSTTTGFGPDGVSGTVGVAGAASVNVTALASDRTHATLESTGGGLIAIQPSKAYAKTNPTVAAAFGSGHITATGDVTLVAESHSDADANTDSSGGGAIQVASLSATVENFPTVTTTIAGGLVQAGGSLRIEAKSGAFPPDLSDGVISCVNYGAGDGSTCSNVADSINFTKPHGLITGDVVVYEVNGLIGGLKDRQAYPIILAGPNGFRLGATLIPDNGADPLVPGEAFIDLDKGTIVFRFDHNLVSGELVRYEADGTAIPGLTPGTVYEVIVVDERQIKLKLPGSLVVGPFAPGTVVDAGTNVIHIDGHNLNSNDAVTYHSPTQLRFLASGVDVDLTDKNGVDVIDRDDDGNIQYSDGNNNIYLGTHGLSTGDIVQYRTSGIAIACSGGSDSGGWSGCVGGRLVNGGYYKVIRDGDEAIQLANLSDTVSALQCFLFGCDAIDIDTGGGATGIHTIARAGQIEMGATDGNTYWVEKVDNNHFKLWTRRLDDPTKVLVDLISEVGVPTEIDASGFIDIGGSHYLERVVGFTTTSIGGTTHRLIIDLTSDGGGKMIGVGGNWGTQFYQVLEALKPSGVDRDVQLVSTGDVANGFLTLQQGSMPAVALTPPYSILAKRMGYRDLVKTSDVIPVSPTTGLVTTKEKLEKEAPKIRRAIRAVFRAVDFARTRKSETVQFIMKQYKMDKDVSEAVYDAIMETLNPSLWLSDHEVQIELNRIAEQSKMKIAMKPAELADFTLTRQVGAEIGR